MGSSGVAISSGSFRFRVDGRLKERESLEEKTRCDQPAFSEQHDAGDVSRVL